MALNPLSTIGLQAPIEPGYTLKIWHGLNPALFTSTAILLLGAALFRWADAGGRWRWDGVPRALEWEHAYDRVVKFLPHGCNTVSRWLRADNPLDYLPIVGLAGSAAVLISLWQAGFLSSAPPLVAVMAQDIDALSLSVALLTIFAALATVLAAKWQTQLIFLSTVGFLVTFYYVVFKAPDLALTQILIESATLILVILLLVRFPAAAKAESRTPCTTRSRRALNLGVSVAVGLMVTALCIGVTSRLHPDPVGPFYLANTVELAMGSNAVNTILVDFRGFDTLLEITVLLIACLGCLGLLNRYKRTPAELAARDRGPGGFGTDEKEARS